MHIKIYKAIKNLLSIDAIPIEYQTEFVKCINRINLTRGKITTAAFIFLEVIMLAAALFLQGERMLSMPGIRYLVMYIIMIIAMTGFHLVFIAIGKDVPGNLKCFRIIGYLFAGFILLWCAGISILDQSSNGQIIVYTVAIFAVAVTPYYKPVTLLMIYLITHAAFILMLLHFQNSSGSLFSNYMNSTSFLVISWAVSCMRYKKLAEAFISEKLLNSKNEELKRMNKELEEANLKLEKLSHTDSLTGVYNRLMFDKSVKREWNRCRRHAIPLSLIMIDIDLFKSFNDNYGHQNGDECIKRIAAVLSECAKRSSDIVARYGGEEFAILLPHMDEENTLELAELMRRKVEELEIPHAYSSISDFATISLGVNTVVPADGISVYDFIRNADKALYKAKKFRNNTAATNAG